jgi:hypothetical protein
VSRADDQFPQRPEIAAAANRPANTLYSPTGPVTRGGSEPPKPMEVVNYRTPQGTASGARPVGTDRGGFVGAATDAEAMRNQQSRMVQDTLASANAASMNRAAETMRENRMTRRGMEGGIAGGPAREPGIWDKPGDSFGDSQMRENRYNSLIGDAANQKGFGASKRAARMLDAAEQMRSPGETAVTQRTAANEQAARLQDRAMQEQGTTARTDRMAQANIAAAEVAQAGAMDKERFAAQQDAQKRSEERRQEAHTRQNDLLKNIGASDEDRVGFQAFADKSGPEVFKALGMSGDDWARYRTMPDDETTVRLFNIYGQNKNQPGFFGQLIGRSNTATDSTNRALGVY